MRTSLTTWKVEVHVCNIRLPYLRARPLHLNLKPNCRVLYEVMWLQVRGVELGVEIPSTWATTP
jgi:hypothetical protein